MKISILLGGKRIKDLSLEEYFELANTEKYTPIKGKLTKKVFNIKNYIFGVLIPDENHPLSTVSCSSSAISIDMWTGCIWGCIYCHSQGCLQDLGNNGRRFSTPVLRTNFKVKDIIRELKLHPYFKRNESIITIGSSSTEPFYQGDVVDNTFEILEQLIENECYNPIWIITKAGIPRNKIKAIKKISKKVEKFIISINWASCPEEIEPLNNNRFLNVKEAHEAGAKIMWYFRPIVNEWNGDPNHLKKSITWVKNNYGNYIDAIITGGLRWTEGIEYGITELNNKKMPNVPKDDNHKEMDKERWNIIKKFVVKNFGNIPLYLHSSCGLSYLLNRNSMNAIQSFKKMDCLDSICPLTQRKLCESKTIYKLNIKEVKDIFAQIGISAEICAFNEAKGLITKPSLEKLNFTIRQTVIKWLSTAANKK